MHIHSIDIQRYPEMSRHMIQRSWAWADLEFAQILVLHWARLQLCLGQVCQQPMLKWFNSRKLVWLWTLFLHSQAYCWFYIPLHLLHITISCFKTSILLRSSVGLLQNQEIGCWDHALARVGPIPIDYDNYPRQYGHLGSISSSLSLSPLCQFLNMIMNMIIT